MKPETRAALDEIAAPPKYSRYYQRVPNAMDVDIGLIHADTQALARALLEIQESIDALSHPSDFSIMDLARRLEKMK